MTMKSLMLALALGAVSLSSAVYAQSTVPGTNHGGNETPYSCSEEMGTLRPVAKQEIRAIGAEVGVRLKPVCQHLGSGGEARASGNGAVLVEVIGRNPVLVAALAEDDYLPKDVVGIAFGRNAVFLYVHKD